MTWQEMADALGIQLCQAGSSFEGCPLLGHFTTGHLRTMHQLGTYRQGTMHWRDRRWSKRGEYNFLFRVADAKTPRAQLPWLRVFYRNIHLQNMANMLGLRFPRSFATEDRARLRAMLGDLTPRDKAQVPDDYRRATRWAARS